MFKFVCVLWGLFAPPPAPPSPIGLCDSADGSARVEWTAEQAMEVRRRVKRACRQELHASPIVCAFYDAVVVRESSGRASRRHTLGKNEFGLGPMGINLASHRDKWPGRDEDPALCTPEASLMVAHAIVWRAVKRYHAESPLDVQAIYSGRWTCHTDPDTGDRRCLADPNDRTVSAICSRMRDRGFSCYDFISRDDLGQHVPLRERRAWVERVIGRPL
jgi:hypothetical protein